ncbi:sodium/hydrogen exchanger 3, putative [Entamoeba histolytica HM-1:IMSS-B]|uniref:Sodium/hydrogen exchanger n=6 Tax=Entamoeba histolytica TaxID=5759 RepID=C4MB25_ENTH1|nr:sodium/proton antiporter, putative [Entamoeba histolytica HM-1:IMSS]EMD47011.1 sodium/proton antiporter, putative [Entamoeba histolytica KU27]EMH72605.1 sodium/hydrogen exchanger 3, putative [Entamoeba histolytica HM-1:IMSS-B]EMS16934.1 sodium/proton antiporter, putative [Entamoeba histolytica HM-3:IMSS]ENY63082.1 sodium/proton antiporter, putative [Entamoeba histolytica HM-1:IMSS-A]GAT99090.1 sodium proton antiporter putative [Entamoeba histolytica]|eukprot:XP_651612.1 sodium/proton antiporter, putative [Entamoeba histolytica HM-1:IMSS]
MTITSSVSEEGEGKSIYEIVGILIVGILIITLMSHIIVRLIPWLHILSESIVSLFIGVIVGLILLVLHYIGVDFLLDALHFAHIFQTIFLPCIIFNAGFTMKKRNFFANIIPILSYAIGGCVLSSLIIGFGIYGYTFLGNIKFIGLGKNNLNITQSLQFGTLLGATDPVATLALFLELNVDPLLYSLVFGESVLNDAVSIVLFHTLDGTGTSFGWLSLVKIIVQFLVISIGSCAIGLFVSYFSAFIFNKMKGINVSSTFNLVLILCVAFLGYFISELLEMSGILTIFVTGAVMSHHHWYSVPENQRPTLYTSVGTLAFVSETLTFISVGITSFSPSNLTLDLWNPIFIPYVILLCFISRAFNIFPITFIMNLRKNSPKITWRHQIMLWYAGLRGAIAVLLSLQMASPIIINTTYSIVLFTNVVIGMTTPPLLKLMKIEMGGSEPLNVRLIETDEDVNINDPNATNSNKAFKKMLVMFDELVLKKWFGGQPRKEKELAQIDPFLVNHPPDGLETDREKVDRMFREHAQNQLQNKSNDEISSNQIVSTDTPIPISNESPSSIQVEMTEEPINESSSDNINNSLNPSANHSISSNSSNKPLDQLIIE